MSDLVRDKGLHKFQKKLKAGGRVMPQHAFEVLYLIALIVGFIAGLLRKR